MTLVCPCGSSKNLQDCCGSYISGSAIPATPELLMRSRYTAYTLHDISYIEKTMLAPANLNFNAEETLAWAKQVRWVKLEVLAASADGDKGTVEFCAHFMFENTKHLMHEISEFERKDGRWYYVNGLAPNTVRRKVSDKISRNEICPCGSSKKYKKCCGKVA